jgi:predicted phage terminase large subunit-like protein
MDLPTTIQAMLQMTYKWPDAYLKLIEDKANGSAIIQMLRHRVEGIVPVNPEGSKLARVHAILPNIESGNVYLPEEAEWLVDFLNECSSFPNGQHDDMVDSMSQALIRMINDYKIQEPVSNKFNWPYPFNLNEEKDSGYIEW